MTRGRPSVVNAAILSTLGRGALTGTEILDRIMAAGLTPNRNAGRNAIQYALTQGYIVAVAPPAPAQGRKSAIYDLAPTR
jgi:hypothetical protein